tara:strand:- start:1948 stop:2400 length:453 start_codon:yes stop_codon:yes gene_type:complete
MGISFPKPEETYRAPRNDMAGSVATASIELNKKIINLKSRLDELENKIKGDSRKGYATATNTTELNIALKELGTRVDILDEQLKEFRIRMEKRETMTNGNYLELQRQVEEFENDILEFIENLNLDPDLREKFNRIEAKTKGKNKGKPFKF